MKKVLVIGANSYIGQKFKDYALNNYKDEISVDLVSAVDGKWKQVDFINYDTILHLAAIVHIKEKKDFETLYYNINCKLAVEVAKKAKERQIKQFIFMSSAAVFGSYSGSITKDTVPKPISYYGKSKLAAEKEIIKLQCDDYRVAIVRPPVVYGDGCKGNYARLVKLSKFTLLFPEYHNIRSMLNIDNLSRYLIDLIINSSAGYFHPQDNEYADTCKIIEKIRDKNGKKTILIPYANTIIKILIKENVGVFKKIFGDFYYNKDLI